MSPAGTATTPCRTRKRCPAVGPGAQRPGCPASKFPTVYRSPRSRTGSSQGAAWLLLGLGLDLLHGIVETGGRQRGASHFRDVQLIDVLADNLGCDATGKFALELLGVRIGR